MNDGKLISIYTGSELTALLLKDELENAGVTNLIKNDFQSGVTAGFSGGVPSMVELYIDEQDLVKAQPLINDFIQVNP